MIRRFLKDIREYRTLSVYLARTGLKAEVANSYLNWIWWVLEPLASMLVYYAIFVRVLGRSQPYYLAFVYTGTLIWSYFDRCMQFAVQSIRLNRDIVTKTYVPKPVFIVSNMLFNSFKMLISVGLLIIVLILQRVPVRWTMLYAVPLTLVLQLLTFGCGLIFLHFGVFVDDLVHAVRIAMHILFYLTGVFYDLETLLPAPWGGVLTRVNPLACIIRNMRQCLLAGAALDWLSLLCWTLLGFCVCALGLKLCYKYENTYVKVI